MIIEYLIETLSTFLGRALKLTQPDFGEQHLLTSELTSKTPDIA